jgi:DNA mismatch endonuclease (patch repair protein)
MPDVVSPRKRSQMMAGIKGKDTKPELLLRKGLHARGFRYRLHDKALPGKPDMVFRRYGAVILVNGCFWHGHSCHLFKWPSSREQFWREKIAANRERDLANSRALQNGGLRVLTVWECVLKGRTRLPVETVLDEVACWLSCGNSTSEISGSDEASKAVA